MPKSVSEDSARLLWGAAWEALMARIAADLRAAGKPADEAAVGEAYLLLYDKLCEYFRARPALLERGWASETLADETLDRLGNSLLQGKSVEKLANYAYGIAKLHCQEIYRKPVLVQPSDDMPAADVILQKLSTAEQYDCLQACLQTLPSQDQILVVRYFLTFSSEQLPKHAREQLAQEFALSPAKLRLRVHRLKEKLLRCTKKCLRQTVSDNY